MRQTFQTNPAQKHLEVLQNFSGGMNTVTAYENMADHEAIGLINQNLVERGPVERRYGMVRHIDITGKGQGYFRYYKNANEFEELEAINGQLYKNGAVLPIEGLASGFQTEKLIEAVQFQNKLWIATGTKLVEYDGTTAKVVEPYKPKPMDALYIGTNGLSENPDEFMEDGQALSMRIDGVTFSERYGIVNEDVTLTAYKSVPSDMSVEFQFEYRYPTMEEGKWYMGQDWGSSNTWVFRTELEGDVQFRINMREAGKTVAEAQYIVPKFKVKASSDAGAADVKTDNINKCNRIILHWNRLIMYGDDTQADALYISHLNNPRYFPIPNSLRLENGRNERMTALLQYRDMLIGFTPTTIQAIYGKSPMDFRRITLNTTIGCMAPDSAKVYKNHVYFLSYDGVYLLKSVGYTEDKANVEKVDTAIANLIEPKENACAAVHDGQYQILFPDSLRRFRCYAGRDGLPWVMDESPKLDFARMYIYDDVLLGQSASGPVMRFDEEVFTDDGYVYEDILETKAYNFGQPYHKKKLKEVQIMTSPKQGTINASVQIYADAALVVNPDQSYATVNDEGEVEWIPFFETNFSAGTKFGAWIMGDTPFGTQETSVATLAISGKCYSTRMKFVHAEAVPSTILGLAYVFKLKRP
jgi:hypothetical protein